MERNTEFPLDPEVIAHEIGIQLDEWHGNCHAIASHILRLMPIQGMTLCRGHANIRAHKNSVFSGGLHQHSWLELADGRILDPTRWTITRPDKPFIYLGINDGDEYDEYGQLLNQYRPSIWNLNPDHSYAGSLKRLKPDQFKLLFPDQAIPARDDSKAWNNLASRLFFKVKEPPEHLENAESFYAALERAGLKCLIQFDKWMKVMEPASVTVVKNANFYYEAPEREEKSDLQIFARILNRFLCVEDRDNIEGELEELGYSLEDDLWQALNQLEAYERIFTEIDQLPACQDMQTLGTLCCFMLGSGFGKEIEVERFAKSLGWPLDKLKASLETFGARLRQDVSWEGAYAA